ncbi:MAG: thymidine phosphorylase [Opitutia bacterium Tous-C8FEB]|nr:MAG: thymidine phosphorylase [Opitutae bacterium Tous-C8FEB]
MSPPRIIARKRDGNALTAEEMGAFVRGATDGTWADYQLSALLMAICLRGLDAEETALYTAAMTRSGTVADLSGIPGIKVDKHSTGGVGDKVSLVLAPWVAACGVPVPMISGRGLGHSGGTLDKLEAIPGFRIGLSLEEYRDQVARIGCALIGQTPELAPADRRLYALRDVTATVESIPLICGSILSKKLAAGIDALVLDVKFGRGAFMPDLPAARELATTLVRVGRAAGKQVRALLTRMDAPLGRAVGNALEVAESIAALRGAGPADLMELTRALGVEMLLLGGVAATPAEANARLDATLASGAAAAKFREVITAQGGDSRVVDDPGRLPVARSIEPVLAPRTGFVSAVDARAVAFAALRLGAGRARAEDTVDPAVGVAGLVQVGEAVTAGEPLAWLHANDLTGLPEARALLAGAFTVGEAPVQPPPLVADQIRE